MEINGFNPGWLVGLFGLCVLLFCFLFESAEKLPNKNGTLKFLYPDLAIANILPHLFYNLFYLSINCLTVYIYIIFL